MSDSIKFTTREVEINEHLFEKYELPVMLRINDEQVHIIINGLYSTSLPESILDISNNKIFRIIDDLYKFYLKAKQEDPFR